MPTSRQRSTRLTSARGRPTRRSTPTATLASRASAPRSRSSRCLRCWRCSSHSASPPGSPARRGSSQLFVSRLPRRLNWRVTLVQFLANAVVIGVLILLLPGFVLHAKHEVLAVLWLAAVFGILTALVRPALEFLFLPYVLHSQYGVDLAFDWPLLGPFRRRMQEWLWRPAVPIVPLPPQVKARLLLEDLGPTYVKLGQIVSSQGRALPREWEEELAKLQSEVRPFAYDDVREIVTRSLGAPPETLYESFNPAPLAAASLAQVHEATTHDSGRVAVKVQRPRIHEQLRADIRILTHAAAFAERRIQWAEDADLTGVVRDFGSTLLRELDYTVEAYNARRLERVLSKVDGVHVPAVDPPLSSNRVLTLEFIDGVKSTNTEAIDGAGLDRRDLARNLVRGAVQMVMIDGCL